MKLKIFSIVLTLDTESLAEKYKADSSVTVHVISMLDYPNQDKRTPSVLDIALKHKYTETNVIFHSVDSLRYKIFICNLPHYAVISELYLMTPSINQNRKVD